MTWKYLKTIAPGVIVLDHKLTPEVSAMFAAMSSRMPKGGIEARYAQIVEAVAEGLYGERILEEGSPVWEDLKPEEDAWDASMYAEVMGEAEDRLCEYPLHPRVQKFFDQFVKQYGHSSILELTGQPAVYTEGISWYTAYMLFDSPLCAGQEFSTRAVRHKDWPMAAETGFWKEEGFEYEGSPRKFQPNRVLKNLHDGWFEIFEAEVAAWAEAFKDPDTRAKYGIADKEPFRPALDRARWAIPGTISTGCCHTGNLRERARILHTGLLMAQRSKSQSAITVWENIRKGYEAALPGMAGMGLREAIYDETSKMPSHTIPTQVPKGPDVALGFSTCRGATNFQSHAPYSRSSGTKSYVDPYFNHFAQVNIAIQCSLAVSRDWHRHRTVYPWALDIVEEDGDICIHTDYEPMSDVGKEKTPEMLQASQDAFHTFFNDGDQIRAMLSLPLGTMVKMSGQAGLRDAIYMFELRRDAHGANFEYQAQAEMAMLSLTEWAKTWSQENDIDLVEHLGL